MITPEQFMHNKAVMTGEQFDDWCLKNGICPSCSKPVELFRKDLYRCLNPKCDLYQFPMYIHEMFTKEKVQFT